MIRKAVITAAGRGTRFLPVTKAYPKELLPILNKPIIQLLVEEVVAAGINQIAIVHLHGNPLIKHYFSPDLELERFLKQTGKEEVLEGLKELKRKIRDLRFIPQPRSLAYGTGAPVLAAKSFIGDEPFVYLYGDDLVLEPKTGQYLKSLIKTFQKYQALAVLGVQKLPWKEVVHYGTIKFSKKSKIPYRIAAIEERLPSNKAPSNFALFGRFVVAPQVIEILKDQKLSSYKELFFTDTITTLAQKSIVVAKPIKEGKWLTTGDPRRWLEANREFQKFQAKQGAKE